MGSLLGLEGDRRLGHWSWIFFVPTEKLVDLRSGLASKTLGFSSVPELHEVESDLEGVKVSALFTLLIGLGD